jgi:hypothetical protein
MAHVLNEIEQQNEKKIIFDDESLSRLQAPSIFNFFKARWRLI